MHPHAAGRGTRTRRLHLRGLLCGTMQCSALQCSAVQNGEARRPPQPAPSPPRRPHVHLVLPQLRLDHGRLLRDVGGQAARQPAPPLAALEQGVQAAAGAAAGAARDRTACGAIRCGLGACARARRGRVMGETGAFRVAIPVSRVCRRVLCACVGVYYALQQQHGFEYMHHHLPAEGQHARPAGQGAAKALPRRLAGREATSWEQVCGYSTPSPSPSAPPTPQQRPPDRL